MLCLATHRNNQGIDTRLFEIRVVNKRRLECVRGITNMGDQFRIAIDRHVLLNTLHSRDSCTQSQQITVCTKATDLAFHNFSKNRFVTEFFTRMNVGHV